MEQIISELPVFPAYIDACSALTLASRFPLLFLPRQLAYCAVNDVLRIVKTFFVA
jgi:hypothetical protein